MARYILYARKSSESEDRQVLSVDSQIRELQGVARGRGLEIASVLSESMSAKAPGRAVFGRMMKEIARSGVAGILCWKLDRLARNPVDGGALIWAVDSGKVREIVTREKRFSNSGDDKFLMQLEFGMAKKYVDDLSDNVKRGNRAKLEQGWVPGIPPLGYMNERAAKTIVPDPERFSLVRQIWDLVLAGHSPAEVLLIANEDWEFRTPKYRRVGGNPLGQSTLYRMLSNPFYYGLIPRNGEFYPGAHEPMITKEKFDRVQEILGRPNRRTRKRHQFAYTGLIRCGECGASVTAEHKKNRFGSRYVYYHCTKRKSGVNCSQGSIEVRALEEQLNRFLERLAIDEETYAWALETLRSLEKESKNEDLSLHASLNDALQKNKAEIDALLDLRLRGLLTDDEYAQKKRRLAEQQLDVRRRMLHPADSANHWFEPAQRTLIFAKEAPNRFAAASDDEKREILIALCSNPVLTDKKLRISAQEPFRLASESTLTSSWQARLEAIRTWFINNPDVIRWPRFLEKSMAQWGRKSRRRRVAPTGG